MYDLSKKSIKFLIKIYLHFTRSKLKWKMLNIYIRLFKILGKHRKYISYRNKILLLCSNVWKSLAQRQMEIVNMNKTYSHSQGYLSR